ncbi:hypothetical protein TNCV_3305831 [Trichonephila clavipes]|nr:hypothetical protein TNCV_3305831 [Trichonephila clavipes]
MGEKTVNGLDEEGRKVKSYELENQAFMPNFIKCFVFVQKRYTRGNVLFEAVMNQLRYSEQLSTLHLTIQVDNIIPPFSCG